MLHLEKRIVVGIARHVLIIPVVACMLATLACSQTAKIAKIDTNKPSIDTLTVAPVMVPDIMPVFPGGEEGLMTYISQNLIYPKSAQEQGIEGRVQIRFVIDKDGSIKNIEILKSVDPACDKESARVIRGMPKWRPGLKDGVNVPVYYNIPILFRLNKSINAQ